MKASLEALISDREGFGLSTITPVQRAVCRAMTGEPLNDLWQRDDVREVFGGAPPPSGVAPLEFVYLAAIRGFKSATAAALAIRATQTVDLRPVTTRGEVPRYSIVSHTTDLSDTCFQHLSGTLKGSSALKGLVLDISDADSTALLRHPSGRPIEIKVIAASKGGKNMAGRWSVGGCFEEAARMVGADEGVANLEVSRKALINRLLPGAQLIYITSGFVLGSPLEKMFTRSFGKPSRKLVSVRAEGKHVNPSHWTPERYAESALDPVNHAIDCLAQFVEAEASAWGEELKGLFRADAEDLPPLEHYDYVAAIDPATRGNAWTFGIMTGEGEGAKRRDTMVLAREWIGTPTAPLRPSLILREIAALCAPYRVHGAYTDGHHLDSLNDHAESAGFELWPDGLSPSQLVDLLAEMGVRAKEGTISLPNDPQLRKDVANIRKRLTPSGYRVALPKTPDGRHCDYAPTLFRLLSKAALPPDKPPPPRTRWAEIEKFDRAKKEDPWGSMQQKLSIN